MRQKLYNMRDRYELERQQCAKVEDWVNEGFYRGKIDMIDQIITLMDCKTLFE